MKNVKQRDFKSKPFEVTSDERGRLHIVAPPNADVKLSSKPGGVPANADGKEEAVVQFIRDNPKLSNKKTEAQLKKLGIPRSASWVGNKKYELFGVGCQTGPI